MPRYLSRWTLGELKRYLRNKKHGPLFIIRDPIERSYQRRKELHKKQAYAVARLKERIRRENIPLPERGSGRRGWLNLKRRWRVFTWMKYGRTGWSQ